MIAYIMTPFHATCGVLEWQYGKGFNPKRPPPQGHFFLLFEPPCVYMNSESDLGMPKKSNPAYYIREYQGVAFGSTKQPPYTLNSSKVDSLQMLSPLDARDHETLTMPLLV